MFAKVFASLWNGSLRGNPDTQLVFIYLLAHADYDGCVEVIVDKIVDDTGLDVPNVVKALETLESPDDLSRSDNDEGRRIEPLDGRGWGWRIINYDKYRRIRDAETRRMQNKAAQQRWRDKQKGSVSIVSQGKPLSAQAEADVEVDAEKSLTSCSEPSSSPNGEPPFIELPSNRNGHPVPIERSLLDEWSSLYPGVDVPGQLRAMRGWLLANPTKRKTANGMLRFVNAWLSREQNRSQGAPVSAPASPTSPEAQEPISRATALTRITKDESDAILFREANPEAGKQARERINELVAGIGKGGT